MHSFWPLLWPVARWRWWRWIDTGEYCLIGALCSFTLGGCCFYQFEIWSFSISWWSYFFNLNLQSRQQAESIAAAEEGESYMNAGRLGNVFVPDLPFTEGCCSVARNISVTACHHSRCWFFLLRLVEFFDCRASISSWLQLRGWERVGCSTEVPIQVIVPSCSFAVNLRNFLLRFMIISNLHSWIDLRYGWEAATWLLDCR